MHPRDAEIPRRPGRFDDETARRILARAAAEQQRLSNERSDSWSAEELQEIAAEAGISPEALRAAIEHRDGRPAPAARERRPFTLGSLDPRNWSKTAALTTGGTVAFLGALLLFPAFAETVLWVLFLTVIVLGVLMLLGASPF